MTQPLVVTTNGFCETWTLNAPERRNALSIAMMQQFTEAIERVNKPDSTVRVVVITGAGDKAFSAGADLKERQTMPQDQVRQFLSTIKHVFRGLGRSRVVFVAAVNGIALGGGTELALACDVRFVTPNAEMGLTEVKLGIIPGGGGTQRLPRLIGAGRAREIIFSGRRVGAEEALRIGLAERAGALVDAEAWAQTVAGNGPIAVAAAKQAIDEGLEVPLDDALVIEHAQYEKTLLSEDRMEGLLAFMEKRAPRFSGR